ncbi:hypothetical protein GXW84_27020 [Rhodococcus sp. IEGM 248]|nr:hypothetical protein [Rhodococcus sp. IEGM 248]
MSNEDQDQTPEPKKTEAEIVQALIGTESKGLDSDLETRIEKLIGNNEYEKKKK